MKKKILNEAGVIEKFGIRADQVCDYLSIVGDHCDNVFGINGIGPKGACKLLQKYGHIENIFLHLNELDDKTKKKIIDGKELLELAYNLISLRYDAIEIENFDKYKLNLNNAGLIEFMKKYNFSTLDKIQKQSFNNAHTLSNKNDDNNQNQQQANTQGQLF